MRTPRIAAVATGLTLCAVLTMAQEPQSPGWSVSASATGPYAATRAADGAFFGKYCFVEAIPCVWIVHAPGLSCPNQVELHITLITDTRRADTTAACDVEDGPSYLFIVKDIATMESTLSGATHVQVLIPVRDGEPPTLDFSLDGMPQALSLLSARVNPPRVNPQCRVLWDQYAACKMRAEDALKKCAVWHGPGPCPDLGPTCYAPNCSP